MCFAFPASPALESALARQRFSITKYLYLSRELKAGGEPWHLQSAMRIAHWREMDAVMSVRLMARAYAGVDSARVFAPRGTLEEWATYLAQLIKMPACGEFMPSASLAAMESEHFGPGGAARRADRDDAAAGHRAYRADRRRSIAAAARAGARPDRNGVERLRHRKAARITLLVSADNAPACALYAAVGFKQVVTLRLRDASSAPIGCAASGRRRWRPGASAPFLLPALDSIQLRLRPHEEALAVDRRRRQAHLAEAVLRELVVLVAGAHHERVAIFAQEVDLPLAASGELENVLPPPPTRAL